MRISRKFNGVLCGVALCLWGFAVQAADQAMTDRAAVVGYGFNWHADPDAVKCIKMTPALVANFKSCIRKEKGDSQTGTIKFECEASGDRSYLIADTLKQCQDAKDTMAANAP